MKVFLSLPFHGYTTREIIDEMDKMKKAVLSITNVRGGVEFVTNYFYYPEKKVQYTRPYCLGEAIKSMSDCDLVVFHPNYENAAGCRIEYRVCNVYDIRYRVLDEEDMI